MALQESRTEKPDRRLDVSLHRETYEEFQAIMDASNTRRREELEDMIHERFLKLQAKRAAAAKAAGALDATAPADSTVRN